MSSDARAWGFLWFLCVHSSDSEKLKNKFHFDETASAGDHLAVAAGVGKGSRNTWIHIFSQDLSRCKKVRILSTALGTCHPGPCERCHLLSIAACNLCLSQSAYQHYGFRQAVNTRAPFLSSRQAVCIGLLCEGD